MWKSLSCAIELKGGRSLERVPAKQKQSVITSLKRLKPICTATGCEDNDWNMMYKETRKQMENFWSGERDGKGQSEVTSFWANGIVEPGMGCYDTGRWRRWRTGCRGRARNGARVRDEGVRMQLLEWGWMQEREGQCAELCTLRERKVIMRDMWINGFWSEVHLVELCNSATTFPHCISLPAPLSSSPVANQPLKSRPEAYPVGAARPLPTQQQC